MNHLVELKQYMITSLSEMTADKCHLLVVNGTYHEGYMDYTVRLLLLDYRADPIEVLSTLKNWLRTKKRHLQKDQLTEIDISFSSEIIDINTFDLEIDFPQRDKINVSDTGYTICKNSVWSDELGQFVDE